MTIKRQFRIYILSIVIIPVISLFLMYMYDYLTRPERILLDGTEFINQLEQNDFTDQQINYLRTELKKIPPDVDYIITRNHEPIYISSPDFFSEAETEQDLISTLIGSASPDYIYQVVSPCREPECTENIQILMRFPKEQNSRPRKMRKYWLSCFIAFTVIFEILLVFLSSRLSRNISASITILEKHTHDIASGKLGKPIKTRGAKDNEITNLTDNLNKMQESLKEIEQKKARFVMGMSHDLRSPIAVIKGYTEALKDGIISEVGKQNSALDIINDKATQLENMINTLMDFVKINSGDLRKTFVKLNLYDFLSQKMREFESTSMLFKRKFRYEIHLDKNCTVTSDPQLFERAIENLYSNAVRYTSENDEISFRGIQDKNRIILDFSDTGEGISRSELSFIFDMFYRSSPARQDGGLGIGLSLVKTITETHGWNLKVLSEKGKGTTFEIIIPLPGEAPQETN